MSGGTGTGFKMRSPDLQGLSSGIHGYRAIKTSSGRCMAVGDLTADRERILLVGMQGDSAVGAYYDVADITFKSDSRRFSLGRKRSADMFGSYMDLIAAHGWLK
jgi:hypothetical protein